jgi:hypothetical protein
MDENEQAAYDTVHEQLVAEYGSLGPAATLMVERVAVATVKLKRLQRVEDALYQRARLVRAHNESQGHPNSISSMLPEGEDSHAFAVAVATAAAMPDIANLDTLARYETTLERQMFKWLQALTVLKDDANKASTKALPQLVGAASELPRLKAAPNLIASE